MERLSKENAVQDSTIKNNLVRLANAQYQRDLRTKQLAELQLKHNDLEKFAKKIAITGLVSGFLAGVLTTLLLLN